MSNLPIVRPNQIPYDTDFLSLGREIYKGLTAIARLYAGKSTVAWGFDCTPTAPASMSVILDSGHLTKWDQLSATSFGSLPPDENYVTKIGSEFSQTTFACTAPLVAGQTKYYIIQATFTESDANPEVLQFYNPDNPDDPFFGPGGNNQALPTVRKCGVTLQLKAGTAAPTVSAVVPAVDAGYVGLWIIRVDYNQTTITAGSITKHPGFPTASLVDYGYSTMVEFTTTQVWTPNPASPKKVLIQVIGGGGGGGGAQSDGAAGGGGGGGMAWAAFVIQPNTSYNLTVGGGGAGGGISSSGNGGSYPNPPAPANAGGNGQTSSFDIYITATGGTGGVGSGPKGTGVGGQGGTGSFANGVSGLIADGDWGDGGFIPGGGSGGRGGRGGGSGAGGGAGRNGIGVAWTTNGTPQPGGKYGGGGGGGGSGNSGAAGGPGVIRVWM